MSSNLIFSARRKFLRTTAIAGGALILGGFKSNSIKKIALIGDSIRVGYQPDVSNYLVEKATVWGPEEDALNTIDILKNLGTWLSDVHFDIIHINSGLHDIRTIGFTGNENLIPLDFYSKNVERVIKLTNRLSPDSIVVWATITPVLNDKFNEFHKDTKDFRLKNEDVIRYNEAAVKIATRLGVALNDLYSYLMEGDPALIMLDDGVHFSGYGNQLLAERVTGVLEKIIDNP